MCGICGFVGHGDRGDLWAMTHALARRGPDGEGQYVDPAHRVHLGHRRLAILDLEGGRQPMWNEDGQVGVVFNGEIYNHLELRQQLLTRGHRFQSDHSDTEVLVHGYEEWGTELPLRLNGMFAFAVYDRQARRLFLARDRFGKKPLFYTRRPGLFAFASELTSLAQHATIDSSIDERSLKKYLAYNFVPAPNSLYRGCRKLPGGHWLTYDWEQDQLKIHCYWRFRIEPVESIPGDAEDRLCDELLHLLSQAVKRRLISDVPLGIFLSGGIDSSAILALAAEHIPRDQLKTFAIGFNEPSFDESTFARRAAAWVGAQHCEQILSAEQARDMMPHVLEQLDEPLGDPSILPTYLVARMARPQITVALGGDGSDELFAGYDTFRILQAARWYARLVPKMLHAVFRFAAGTLPMSARNMSFDFKVRRGLRGLSYSQPLWNSVWHGALEPKDIADLFGHHVSLEDLYSEALEVWDTSQAKTLADRTLEFYTCLFLPDDILVKLDRATMMNGLEARSPFLDNDVVEFTRKLPTHFKYRRGTTKYLLKKALLRVLPKDIVFRKKKGFGIPLTQWLRDWSSLFAPSDVPVLDPRWVKQRWDEHCSGKADHRHFLWTTMTLQRHTCTAPAVLRATA
jgi:asparagine synthase (glutamine-hydrolysing)